MTQSRKNRNTHNKTKKKYIFNKNDYNAGDGMIVNIWGPAMWHYLHIMSFNYPVNPTNQNKKHYKDFIYNLRNVLPCKYCRINLTNNLKEKPLLMCHMKSRATFSKYIYELHEVINKMLGKKSNLTYCDVRDRYEQFRSRCTEDKRQVFTFKRSKTIKKEKGCTEPLYGKKSKCVINIIPQEDKRATFQMDKKCIKSKE